MMLILMLVLEPWVGRWIVEKDESCAFVVFLHAEKMEEANAWKLLLLADERGPSNPFLHFHEHSLTRCR